MILKPNTALMTVAILTSCAMGQSVIKPTPDAKSRFTSKPQATFTEHSTEVTALTFSRDGKRIFSVSSKEVRQWNAESGMELQRCKAVSGSIAALRTEGPDGPILAATELIDSAERSVVLRTGVSGRRLLAIPRNEKDLLPGPGYGFYIDAMTFSPDGKRLATCATSWLVGGPHGGKGGVVRIWDAQTGKLIRHLGEVKRYGLRYTKSGVIKVIRPDTEVRTGLSTTSNPEAMAFSADGKYLAVGTKGHGGELPEPGEVWVWDSRNGRTARMLTMQPVPPGNWADSVTAVALSHDSKWLAAAVGISSFFARKQPEFELEVRIWELASGRQVQTLRGHKGLVAHLAFSPDSKLLASAGSDQAVRLWSTSEWNEVIALPFDIPQINSIAFSPDGSLLAAGGGNGEESGQANVWATPRK